MSCMLVYGRTTYQLSKTLKLTTAQGWAQQEKKTMNRNSYNALTEIPKWVDSLIYAAEAAGTFTRGIETDRKGRGEAVNVDLFGYDEAQGLIVIQVRQATLHPRKYTRVRKDYYLIGRTEQGSIFAHPVESPARSKRAMESPESTVRYVLAKVWDCKESSLEEIERQGDVAFIPVYRIPKTAEKIDGHVTIRDTHQLKGDIWRDIDGTIYTRRGARLMHSKRQHAPIKAKAGAYRVQPGIRATTWGFTAPCGD